MSPVFRILSPQSNFIKRVLIFLRRFKSRTHLGYRVVKYAAMIMCADRAERSENPKVQ